MGDFLIQNLDVVYFFYGLAFLVLGISIFAQLRATHESQYRLVNILWLLAAFGVIHGLHEFLEISTLERHLLFLDIINFLTVGASYVLLFFFGFRLVNISGKKLGDWVPALAALLFFALPLLVGATSLVTWTISARYFFGLVGASMSAVGLLYYYASETDRLAKTPVKRYFISGAVAFVLYGLSAGLVVGPADFPPASLINTDSFTAWFGFPPQLLRALAAAAMAVSIWQIVNIFNLEQAAEREEADMKLRRARDELEIRVEERTDQLEKSKELSDALNRINAAINSSLDFEKIMQTVVRESGQAIGAEVVAILLHENGDWVLTQVYGRGDGPLAGTRFTVEEARGAVLAAAAREPFVSNDTYTDPKLNTDVIKEQGIRSIMVLPLIVRGEAAGALSFSYRSAPVTFDEAQIDFGRKLAVSVSLALENARLFAAEHHIAQTLQEALLSVPQALPGIEVGHLYRSATEAAQVGGDFYNVFQIQPGKIGIVIGDVAGKGVSAATLTVLVENTIKVFAHQGYSPADVLDKANDVINQETKQSVFVTVFFCILDTEAGLLTYCSAGHPPTILKRKTGQTELLHTASPVIGVFGGLSFKESGISMEAGDMLLLYTDGVTEARRPGGEFFGEKRLLEAVQKAEPGTELTRHIFEAVVKFTGGALADDVAMLAILVVGD